MPAFIPGLDLAEALYTEAVEPILCQRFPDLRYAAARIGTGSDVLGFDDERSMDHFWGPLLHLFLDPGDLAPLAEPITSALANELPRSVRGVPTNFRPFEGEEAHLGHLGHLQPVEHGPINHGVMLATVGGYFTTYLGVDPAEVLDNVAVLRRLRAAYQS